MPFPLPAARPAALAASVLFALLAGPALAQQSAQRLPEYLKHTWPAALKVPRLPGFLLTGIPPLLPASQLYLNADGMLGVVQTGGTLKTGEHPFFQSLGSNGRSCGSCHLPENGMSLSAATAGKRWLLSGGRDPLFAPVDGANCPSQVGALPSRSAHSLLLEHGLFRVFLPVPKQAEFTVTVVSDPYGCNTDPAYATQVNAATGENAQMVSVYRRPRMSANLKFMTATALTVPLGPLPNIDMVTGEPVVDPATGAPISGNIMWDGREPTLESQAISATLGHAQAATPPSAAQVAQIVAYENSVFTAQSLSLRAGDLSPTFGATAVGGPTYLAGQGPAFGNFTTFDAWNSAKLPARASVARGQALFNTRQFSVGDVAGFNNAQVLGVPNPVSTTCSSCHGGQHVGTDPFPAGQRDIGIGGHAAALGGPPPVTWLPIFKVTCKAPASTAFLGKEVLTNDPGKALITGRCADVGRKSVPQIRALAARAPYFSDGSAATVADVVRHYDKRFSMGLTAAEVNDLVNFLSAL